MAAKKKHARNDRKFKRFQQLHPSMTRTEWAKAKRQAKLNKQSDA